MKLITWRENITQCFKRLVEMKLKEKKTVINLNYFRHIITLTYRKPNRTKKFKTTEKKKDGHDGTHGWAMSGHELKIVWEVLRNAEDKSSIAANYSYVDGT